MFGSNTPLSITLPLISPPEFFYLNIYYDNLQTCKSYTEGLKEEE